MIDGKRDFLDLKDFTGAELRRVLNASAALKADRRKGEIRKDVDLEVLGRALHCLHVGYFLTSTVFAPFPGFRAMASYPEYSADFFDGEHVVMKGASMATAKELLRPSFRNWFRARYPYVYATFRCAT